MRQLQENDKIYDGSSEAFANAQVWIDAGYQLVCHRCRELLIVALDFEAANRLKVHPGIYCPTNANHVCILIELNSPERHEMRKKWRKLREEQ
jgi:hypothetical protein